MKANALIALFLACSLAQAASLQQPVTYFNPICGNAPVNEQTVSGFSADGAYVLVQAKGYTACGSSGRGGGSVSYKYWCEQLTYDLSGNLVSVTPIKPSTYAGYNTCPWADPSSMYTNAGAYTAYTERINWNSTLTAPELDAP